MANKRRIENINCRFLRGEQLGWDVISNVDHSVDVGTAPIEFLTYSLRRQRAHELRNLGFSDAVSLKEHGGQILVRLRRNILIFLGTEFRSEKGTIFVPYLFWEDRKWKLAFTFLSDLGWGDRVLFACVPKSFPES